MRTEVAGCFAPPNSPSDESAVADMTALFMFHSIPDLNINNFIRFQRLADRDPEQRI